MTVTGTVGRRSVAVAALTTVAVGVVTMGVVVIVLVRSAAGVGRERAHA